jgi:hypothetical protein
MHIKHISLTAVLPFPRQKLPTDLEANIPANKLLIRLRSVLPAFKMPIEIRESGWTDILRPNMRRFSDAEGL